ncbi:lytic transglycosylase domain-containing protein [Pollutimonas bauzanensis]|uniref:Type IV secretion system protein VirB1 n=1 Tax=Pollutimonas bauzanensis TaxID=658167 RepID=A0A1M5YHS1_9BURK|nr:lytic transglycosylase domain-containing protein [Pollutimonas bauzanensis]SHI11580.1 type IV secretion system protein VirB1 [Pollutimonas bauzanensis]
MMEFLELAKVCAPQVHASTLVALVRQESGFDPLVIHVNGKPGRRIRPKSWAEAIQEARKLLDQGASFDAGYGQINSGNWSRLGITPENVFDPCINLRAAQRVLVECYQGAGRNHGGQAALYAALSCYNTGDYTSGLRNGYVRNVLAGAGLEVPALPRAAPETKAAPMGQRTESAKGEPKRPGDADGFGRRHDTFEQPRADAFAKPRPDAFAQPRADAFAQPPSTRVPVGSIIYHSRSQE